MGKVCIYFTLINFILVYFLYECQLSYTIFDAMFEILCNEIMSLDDVDQVFENKLRNFFSDLNLKLAPKTRKISQFNKQ